MQVHKSSGISGEAVNAGKNGGRVGSNAPASQPAANAASAANLPAAQVARSVPALAAAMGLPADGLSASIVAFARFFSLPFKPELLADIRRQALGSPPQTAPAALAEKAAEMPAQKNIESAVKAREALAFAAAAAESKGLGLSQQGLEAYASAIDPDQEQQGLFGRQGGGGRKQQGRPEPGKEIPGEKTTSISADSVREMALAGGEIDPLLAIVNRLPGKNGRRWLVFPFNFCTNGRNFNVSLRILLEDSDSLEQFSGNMVVDIVESGEEERRWLFSLHAAGTAVQRLNVFLQLDLPPQDQAQLAHELSSLLDIPPGCVSVRAFQGAFPGEADCADDLLRSINEAV